MWILAHRWRTVRTGVVHVTSLGHNVVALEEFASHRVIGPCELHEAPAMISWTPFRMACSRRRFCGTIVLRAFHSYKVWCSRRTPAL